MFVHDQLVKAKKEGLTSLKLDGLCEINYLKSTQQTICSSQTGTGNFIDLRNDNILMDTHTSVFVYNTKENKIIKEYKPSNLDNIILVQSDPPIAAAIYWRNSKLMICNFNDPLSAEFKYVDFNDAISIIPLSFSSNVLGVTDKNSFHIFDFNTQKSIKKLDRKDIILAAEVSNEEIVIVDRAGCISIWNHLHSSEKTLIDSDINDFKCITYNSELGLAVANDKVIYLWDIKLTHFKIIPANCHHLKKIVWLSNGKLALIEFKWSASIITCSEPYQKIEIIRFDSMLGNMTQINNNTFRWSGGHILGEKGIFETTFEIRAFKFSDLYYYLPLLQQCTSLISLNLDNLAIEEKDLPLLITLFRSSVLPLTKISLKNCGLTSFACLQIISACKANPNIKEVNIDENPKVHSDLKKQVEEVLIDNLLLPNTLQIQLKQFDIWEQLKSCNSLDFNHLYALEYNSSFQVPRIDRGGRVASIIPYNNEDFIVASLDGSVTIYSTTGLVKQKIRLNNNSFCRQILLLSSNRLIGIFNKIIEIWDIQLKKKIKEINCQNLCVSIVKINDYQFITGDSNGQIILWDSEGNKIDTQLVCNYTPVINLFSAVSNLLGVRAVWALELFKKDDCNILFIGGSDGVVQRFNISNNKITRTSLILTINSPIYALKVINNQFLTIGSENGQLIIFDIIHEKKIFDFNVHKGAINCITALYDDLFACGSADKTISIWDARYAEKINALSGHEDHINSIASMEDGTLISGAGRLSSTDDYSLRIWKMIPIKLTKPHIKLVLNRLHQKAVYYINFNSILFDEIDLFHELLTFINKSKTIQEISFQNSMLENMVMQIDSKTKVPVKRFTQIDQLIECMVNYNHSIIRLEFDEKNSLTEEQAEKLKQICERNASKSNKPSLKEIINAEMKKYNVTTKERNGSTNIFLKEKMVTVCIWRRRWFGDDKRVGHVSLRTYGKNGINASYWPINDSKDSKRKVGVQVINIASPSLDSIFEGNFTKYVSPDEEINLFSLDTEKINAHYNSFKSLNYNWSLWGSAIFRNEHTRNCSGLVMELLRVGGAEELLKQEKIGQVTNENRKKMISILTFAAFMGVGTCIFGDSFSFKLATSSFDKYFHQMCVKTGFAINDIPENLGPLGSIGSLVVTPNAVGNLVAQLKEIEKEKFALHPSNQSVSTSSSSTDLTITSSYATARTNLFSAPNSIPQNEEGQRASNISSSIFKKADK